MCSITRKKDVAASIRLRDLPAEHPRPKAQYIVRDLLPNGFVDDISTVRFSPRFEWKFGLIKVMDQYQIAGQVLSNNKYADLRVEYPMQNADVLSYNGS